MNITGGTARGQRIKVPSSKDSLRPTQNQVRLAVFSILESTYLSGLRYDEIKVVDLFAGTGALGLEALSRGVTHVDFVEKNRQHAQIIQENLDKTKLFNHGDIYTESVDQFLRRPLLNSYDLVFLDPPYKFFETIKLGELFPIINPTGVFFFFHDQYNVPLNTVKVMANNTIWTKDQTRTYGTTAISIYINSKEATER